MRGIGFALALGLTVTAAGCGSSSGGWQVVKKLEARGSTAGFIDNAAVSRPARIEVNVEARPSIEIRTSYAFICGSVMTDQSPTHVVGATKTPATVELAVPTGPPDACRLNVLVRKSGAADMTLTLRMRTVSVTTT